MSSPAQSTLTPKPASSTGGEGFVLCFGEMLWDCLPAGLFPGGAPFNVGYHLHRRNIPVHLVSAVGRDFLGDELCRRIEGWGLDTSGTLRLSDSPTGTVIATLGAKGDAHYEITRDVAWDKITVTPATRERAHTARAVVFGSLAQRSDNNRASLQELLSLLPDDAERVFDVNLRAPFDDLVRVRALAKHATLLKLNDEEAAKLTGLPRERNALEKQARQLAAESGARCVVITAGPEGAGLLAGDIWYREQGRPVKVVDTIGSGDSFLATFVSHRLKRDLPPAAQLERACRVGEWVATFQGATPAYTAATPQ